MPSPNMAQIELNLSQSLLGPPDKNFSTTNLDINNLDKNRIKEAKIAFENNDASASAAAHAAYATAARNAKSLAEETSHPEKTLEEGEFVRPAVFGGIDGISTSFALLAGAISMNLPLPHLVAISVAQILAGAFSMAFGEYVSSSAERQIALREQKREKWEVDNFPDGERAEMIEIYVKNGLNFEDAKTVANTLSKYPKFWVEHMLLHEIGILPPGEDQYSAHKSSIAMFFSFLIFGAVPIVTYLAFGMLADEEDLELYGFQIACLVTLATFFVLGAVKNAVTENQPIIGGLQMAFQGCVAGGMSYYIGGLVSSSAGGSMQSF